MEKLIITCAVNDPLSWKEIKGLSMPVTTREIADSVRSAQEAGASVVHINEPLDNSASEDTLGYNLEAWQEVARLIRQESNVIFEHGQNGFPYITCEHRIPPVPLESRQQVCDLGAEKPDMIATMLTNVDYEFGPGYHFMPTRVDIKRLLDLCRMNGVKPSFEGWHIGAFAELKWLADNKLVEPPYWFTLFFGSTSSEGSWATTEELFHRVRFLPENARWQISVCCGVKGMATTQQQLAMLTQAMILGGHVRVGMADNPYYNDGVPAENNARLVERIVHIAREIGREVATSMEARQILGLIPR